LYSQQEEVMFQRIRKNKVVFTIVIVLGVMLFCCILAVAFSLSPAGQRITEENNATNTAESIAEADAEATSEQLTAEAPTATPIPTDTPAPTSTAVPTETPIPPTDTPVPTDTPAPTATPITYQGMGVGRDLFLERYASDEIGFTFEDSSDVDGQIRIMGTSPLEVAMLELIGPEDNLVAASLMFAIPNDRPDVIELHTIYALGLLNTAAPEWDDGVTWFTENLVSVADGGSANTTIGDKTVTVQFLPELSFVLLSVENTEWSERNE
jgi:hypothetical protein